MPPQVIGPDAVARGGEVIPSIISLKKIDCESEFDIEAMFFIRLYQRLFVFVISFNTMP